MNLFPPLSIRCGSTVVRIMSLKAEMLFGN
jgi:hypothetical protein